MDLYMQQTLLWCLKHGINIQITNEDGLLAITAVNGIISATYAIPEPYTEESIGQAFYAAIHSIKFGSEHHAKYGFGHETREGNSREKT